VQAKSVSLSLYPNPNPIQKNSMVTTDLFCILYVYYVGVYPHTRLHVLWVQSLTPLFRARFDWGMGHCRLTRPFTHVGNRARHCFHRKPTPLFSVRFRRSSTDSHRSFDPYKRIHTHTHPTFAVIGSQPQLPVSCLLFYSLQLG
jgi:hypothetical protein